MSEWPQADKLRQTLAANDANPQLDRMWADIESRISDGIQIVEEPDDDDDRRSIRSRWLLAPALVAAAVLVVTAWLRLPDDTEDGAVTTETVEPVQVPTTLAPTTQLPTTPMPTPFDAEALAAAVTSTCATFPSDFADLQEPAAPGTVGLVEMPNLVDAADLHRVALNLLLEAMPGSLEVGVPGGVTEVRDELIEMDIQLNVAIEEIEAGFTNRNRGSVPLQADRFIGHLRALSQMGYGSCPLEESTAADVANN